MVDLSKLKVFYVVAQAGSFTEASNLLNISQSSLSRSVSLFEHRIKARLFFRSTKGLTLTHEGARVYDFARRVLDEAALLSNHLNRHERGNTQVVKILTTPHTGASWLIQYLAEFSESNPKICFSIINKLQKIDMQDADVAIGPYVTSTMNLRQHMLKSYHLSLWASPQYLEKYGTPRTVDELNRHQLLAFDDGIMNQHPANRWILDVGTTKSLSRKAYMSLTSLEELITATIQGGGIAALSHEWPSMIDANLVPILPELKGPQIDLYFVCKEPCKSPRSITALADFIAAKLEEVASSSKKIAG